MIRKKVFQKLGIVSLFGLVFLAGLICAPMIGQLAFPKTIGRLNVSIYPKNATLYKGETETFYAMVLNGSGNYQYEWAVNGTITWHEALYEFGFSEPCKIVVLSVFVRDSEGNTGYASEIVYDPIATGSYYLDTPLPLYTHYVGQYSNESSFAINGTNWDNFLVNENASYVFNSVSDATTSGTIFVGSGNYNITAFVKLKSNVNWETDDARLYLGLKSADTTQRTLGFYANADVANITIKGFEIDGMCDMSEPVLTGHVYMGIYFRGNQSNIKILDNYVHHFRKFGIKTRADTNKEVHNVWIVGNFVEYIGLDGITLMNNDNTGLIHNCFILENTVAHVGDISIGTGQVTGDESEITYVVVADNNIYDIDGLNGSGTSGVAQQYGIRMEDGSYCTVERNIITNVRVGIADILSGEGHNVIANNQIHLGEGNTTTAADHRGIDVFTSYNDIYGNYIASPPSRDWFGIYVFTNDAPSYNRIHDNHIVELADSTGLSKGLLEEGAGSQYNHYYCNTFENLDYPVWNLNGGNATLWGNIGYNPVGYDATPVLDGVIRDKKGTGAIANDTQYDIADSPKNIFVYGGTVFAVKIDGQTVFTETNVMVHVVSGQTFEVEMDGATIKSFSE